MRVLFHVLLSLSPFFLSLAVQLCQHTIQLLLPNKRKCKILKQRSTSFLGFSENHMTLKDKGGEGFKNEHYLYLPKNCPQHSDQYNLKQTYCLTDSSTMLYVTKLYLSIFLRNLEDTRSKSFFIKIKTRCEMYFASQLTNCTAFILCFMLLSLYSINISL